MRDDPRRVFRGRRRHHRDQHVQRDADRAGRLRHARIACARSIAPRRRIARECADAGPRARPTSRASSPARSARPTAPRRSRPTSTIRARATSRYDELVAAYGEAVEALAEGGADLILVETDLRHAERQGRAVRASRRTSIAPAQRLPLIVSGTITDASGRTLSGQTPEAFWNAVRHVRPLAVGLELRARRGADAAVHRGDRARRRHVRVVLSERRAARTRWRTPATTRRRRRPRGCSSEFAQSGFVNIVGGCCGTTPAHIRAIADAVRSAAAACAAASKREAAVAPSGRALDARSTASLIACPASCASPASSRSSIGDDSLFVNVGERTNVTGSRAFAQLILAGDFAGAVEVARQQVAERRADHRRQHGRGDARLEGGDGALPEPHRRPSPTSRACR